MASTNSRGGLLQPRTPQRQRGRDRVAGLIDAATALFLEKGFDATTMTEIASRAGASIGSLYLFFPTKPAVAHAVLSALADDLSARLDQLQPALAGRPASDVAEAIFDTFATFLAQFPVYHVLVDVPGEHEWRLLVRARRRAQIATLFAQVAPPLPAGQAERLAVIVPQLMRIAMSPAVESGAEAAILDELRAMLRRHLRGPGDEDGAPGR